MRRRILFTMVAMLLATGALLGIPLSVIAWWWVSDSAHQDLDARLKVISDELIRTEGADDLLPPDAIATTAVRFLLPHDGQLTLHYPGPTGERDATVVGGPIDGPTLGDSIGLGNAGTLYLEIPLEQVRDDQLAAVGIVVLVVATSVVAGTVVAAITAGRIADPLTDLADRAAAMARGDFRSSWKTYGIDELDGVSKALGDANAEIALRLEREGEIVGDVSHQLRSRLTAIQLRLDELSLHDDAAVVSEAEAALDQVARLARDLDEMVAAARDEAGDPQPIDVPAMVDTLVGDFRQGFDADKRSISTEITGEPAIRSSRPGRLREAISVLVDNALQHGGGACVITVANLPSGEMVRITVADEGAGIADRDAGHIFRRGYSVGHGHGVGLSLARALVEADGGRLELTSRRPPAFSIVLPSAQAEDVGAKGPSAGDGMRVDRGAAGQSLMRDRVPHR